ncbi:hypothetical protein UA70_23265 [Raoultella planticola]|nr:hypothetical protein UA70_23265 [Raoultella planticola]
MTGTEIAEGQRRAERNAGTGVGARHHGIHIVTNGIKALDRLTLLIKNLGILAGDQASRLVTRPRDVPKSPV